MSAGKTDKKSQKSPERKTANSNIPSAMTVKSTKDTYSTFTLFRKRLIRLFHNPYLSNILGYGMAICLFLTLTLVIVGALNVSITLPLYLCAVATFFTAVIFLIIYIRINKCFASDFYCNHECPVYGANVATIDNVEYYSQLPPGGKTDYPMGPHLIMTLPRTAKPRSRPSSPDTPRSEPRSAPVTPAKTRTVDKRMPLRPRNLPPLASVETLSPSLAGSSYISSIDSVV